jgi:hypothetical protein
MIPKHPWKLVPLAAMFALGLFMFAGGLGPPAAQANVDAVNAPEGASDGDTVEITVEAEVDVGDLIIQATTDGSGTLVLDNVSCDPSCSNDIDDEGTDTVTIDTGGVSGDAGDALLVTLELEIECEPGDIITITATDDDDDESAEIECIEVNVTITKVAVDDPDEEFEFSVTAAGSADCEGSFTLSDDQSELLQCEADVEYTVSEDLPDGFTVTIDCSDTGSPDIDINEEDAEVVFTLGEDETIECTFENEGGGGAPDTVTVSAAPNAVNCNSISFISIVVRDADGQGVEDGTPITVATNIGSLNQTSTQTTGGGGGATVIFTAPANSGGTSTVTATSGGKSGNATIQVNCAAATAVPPTVVPTAVPGTVTPPSTGDAGLADSGSSRQTTAGALLIAGSLLGGLAIVRRRA